MNQINLNGTTKQHFGHFYYCVPWLYFFTFVRKTLLYIQVQPSTSPLKLVTHPGAHSVYLEYPGQIPLPPLTLFNTAEDHNLAHPFPYYNVPLLYTKHGPYLPGTHMLHYQVLLNVAGSLRPDHQLLLGPLHHGPLLHGQQRYHLQLTSIMLVSMSGQPTST